MVEPPNIEQLRESVRRMGPNWVDTDPNFKASWWSIPDRDFQSFADAARFLLSLLDEGGRLVVEQPCEHGELEEHSTCGRGEPHDPDNFSCVCPGGSRRVVWPKEEA